MLQKITPCPCCNGFDCLNIDHDPYQTVEYNQLASKWRDEGSWEEFYQKKGNGYMFSFHKERRLALGLQLDAIRIVA
jgi:hypothetical protein